MPCYPFFVLNGPPQSPPQLLWRVGTLFCFVSHQPPRLLTWLLTLATPPPGGVFLFFGLCFTTRPHTLFLFFLPPLWTTTPPSGFVRPPQRPSCCSVEPLSIFFSPPLDVNLLFIFSCTRLPLLGRPLLGDETNVRREDRLLGNFQTIPLRPKCFCTAPFWHSFVGWSLKERRRVLFLCSAASSPPPKKQILTHESFFPIYCCSFQFLRFSLAKRHQIPIFPPAAG